MSSGSSFFPPIFLLFILYHIRSQFGRFNQCFLNFVAIGEPTVIELESGDINGDNLIDAVDATRASIEYAHLATEKESTLSGEQQKAADVNGDGLIDAVDSSYILRYYAKISAGQNITFDEFIKNN